MNMQEVIEQRYDHLKQMEIDSKKRFRNAQFNTERTFDGSKLMFTEKPKGKSVAQQNKYYCKSRKEYKIIFNLFIKEAFTLQESIECAKECLKGEVYYE